MRVGELIDVLLELDEDDVVLVGTGSHIQFIASYRAHDRGTIDHRPCGCKGCPGRITEEGDPVPVPASVTLGATIWKAGLVDPEPPVRLYGRHWSRELKEHHRV